MATTTATFPTSTTAATSSTAPGPYVPVAFDVYRDIHKGIRAELFALTGDAGRVDPADDCGVAALADQVRRVVAFLVSHAEHEDAEIQPVIEVRRPALAATIAADHAVIEARMGRLVELASTVTATPASERRSPAHELYVELAAFTGAYLLHQDLEERVVGPALEAELGVVGVLGVHQRIIASIPPQELAESLAVMLPAMNVDDRCDMLGGIRAEAPPEAFGAIRSLARSVLAPDDFRALDVRLGLD